MRNFLILEVILERDKTKKKGSKTEPQEKDIKGKPHNFVKSSVIIG